MSVSSNAIPRLLLGACEQLARGWRIYAPPLAGLAIGCALFALTPPTYTSTVSFFPPSMSSSAMSGVVNQLNALGMLSGAPQGKTQAEQYVAMLKSRSVADAVAAKFDLPHVYGKTLPEHVRRILAKRTRVYMSSRSELIEVTVEDGDPQRVAKMSRYYLDALTDLLGRVAVTDARERRTFLEKQFNETRAGLDRTEQALRGAGISPTATQLEPSAALGMVAQLNASIAAQEIRLSALRSVAGSANPATLAATGELDALKRRLAELQSGQKSAPGDAYASLYRDYRYHSALLEALASQLASARIDEARDARSLQIVDYPVVPQVRSKPNGLYYGLGGIVLGVMISAGAWLVVRTFGSRAKRNAT
ncbi:transport-related membrane protein [Caballeronia hypogeia]|uniref:Transport-related membrane protein n=1 Tax=Caballeronia hypogeia TaxID=1777140 RepID=A0A158DF82_9BURK|nr:hypothetical protein [Caballeronia hypogeia]SAK92926.1 transport-related membrane protein [Caballeronia hypogeia]